MSEPKTEYKTQPTEQPSINYEKMAADLARAQAQIHCAMDRMANIQRDLKKVKQESEQW